MMEGKRREVWEKGVRMVEIVKATELEDLWICQYEGTEGSTFQRFLSVK